MSSELTAPPRPWPPGLALAAVVALLAGLVSLHEIDNFDTWINVKAGEYILQEGVPETDVFSHTVPGNPWVYHEWLSAVALELIHRTAGLSGLVLFTALVAATCFGLMLLLAARQGVTVLAAACAALAALAAVGRFSVRCHLFTLLFFSIFLFILERNRVRRTPWVFALIPLQLVWVNLHGGFALGIALIGAYVVGGGLATLPWLRNHSGTGERASGYLKSLTMTLLVCVGVLFVNPYGSALALKPFLELGSEKLTGDINEWAPPLEYTPFPPTLVFYYQICLGLAAVALLAQLFRPRPAHVLVLLGLGILSLTARRHIGVFALALVPILATGLAGLLANRARLLGLGRKLGAVAVLVFVGWVAISHVNGQAFIRDHSPARFGTGPCPVIQPVAALDFLEAKGVEGTIFNNYSVGGYVAYRLFPEHKVFVDGRNVMYGDFLEEYDRVLEDPATVFPEFEERFGLGTAVLRITSPGVPGLLSYLNRREDWSLAYADQVAAVFLRGEHETVYGDAVEGEAEGLRYPVQDLARAQLHNALGEREKAVEVFEAAIASRDYPVPEAHLGIANLYFSVGQIDLAEKAGEAATKAAPGWAEAYLTLARIQMLHDPPYLAAAEKNLLACLEILPKSVEARVQYSVLLATSQEPGKAEEILLEVVEEHPEEPGLIFTLAQLYEGQRKIEEAKETYRRVLEIDSGFYPAVYALGAVSFMEQRWEDAKSYAEQALEIRPGEPKATRLLYESKLKLGLAEPKVQGGPENSGD